MSSLQMLINTGHQKVQNNAVKASQIWVKQRQNNFCHNHLDHVSPSHTPVVGVCMCCLFPRLRPSFPSHDHMGRRAVRLIVVLLLLLSGDVETNPGPVGEDSVFNIAFPLTTVLPYHAIQ